MSEINCISLFLLLDLVSSVYRWKTLGLVTHLDDNVAQLAELGICWWYSPFLTSTHFVATMCNFHFPCSIIEILTLILDISLRLPTHPSKAKLSHLVLLNLFKLEILLNFRRVLASIFHFLCLVLCQLNRICRD